MVPTVLSEKYTFMVPLLLNLKRAEPDTINTQYTNKE